MDKQPGRVLITPKTVNVQGSYTCKTAIQGANRKVLTKENTLFIKIVQNDTTNKIKSKIDSFVVPQRIKPHDDYWVNCSYTVDRSETLVSLNISLDGKLIYSYDTKGNVEHS